MTSGGELFATIGGRDVGLSAILQKVEAEMAHGADSAVKLGQQYARLAQAQGQPALASQVLAGTMERAGTASERAIIGLETQAARLQSSGSYFQQFGQSAASSLTSIIGPAAAAGAAITALKGVGDSFVEAFSFEAKLEASRNAIGIQLRGLRDSNEVFQQASQFARQYGLTQADTTEAIQASVPVIRQSKASIEDILGVFARLKVLKPEKTFGDAARAIGELQAGQIVSIVDQFNISRAAANKMKNEIAGGADAVQVLSKYLADAGIGMDSLAAQTQGAAGKMRELAQAQEDLKIAQGQFAQGPGMTILNGQIAVTTGLTRVLSGNFEDARRSIVGYAEAGSFGFKLFDAVVGGSLSQLSLYQIHADQAAAATQRAGQAAGQAAGTSQQFGAAMDEERQAAATLTQAREADTQATIADIAKKQEATLASQQLASMQQTLAGLGSLVAGGLLTAGNAAAQLAGQYNIAYQEALKLIQAQAQIAGKSVAVARVDVRSDVEDIQAQKHAVVIKQRQEQFQAAQDAQRAEERYQAVLKNYAPSIAHARAELAQTTKGTAAYYDKLAEVARLEQQQEAANKKGGGGGGGVGKLSDQQKLQNSLLDSQQQYEDKSADAARQYALDVEKIYQDYYAKMRQAQADFDQHQLDGRAGFYDTLGQIEDQKIRQSASAAYEQAAQEAGKIAEEKGADVADKYMSAQERIIAARAQRQAAIEKAQKEKNSGEAEYLRGVDKLHRDAEDAELARIKEGNDSIAAERDKQLQDAADKEDAAQDKIGTAADRAADRKIAAADRAGKKIDEEQLKLDQLARSYDRVAPARGLPASGAPPASAPTPTAAAPGEPTPAADPVADAVNSAKDAIVAALAAIERATRETTGAVKGLRATGGLNS